MTDINIMNFTKVFSLIVLIVLVQSIVTSFPFLGFIILWLGAGIVTDKILIKVGDVEAIKRQKFYVYDIGIKNFYAIAIPIRILSFVIPPIALVVGLILNYEDVREAFPQIPKFRNPFYYD
jgi:hypothetical protein